jgi:hypothetical protein
LDNVFVVLAESRRPGECVFCTSPTGRLPVDRHVDLRTSWLVHHLVVITQLRVAFECVGEVLDRTGGYADSL